VEGDEIAKLVNPSPAFGYYETLLNISKMLYNKNPDRWIEDYTRTLNSLGNLYSDTNQIKKAEKLYKWNCN
jgi:hypothetical protein